MRDDAPPMCPNCWELRSKTVKPEQSLEAPDRLQKVGMYVGFAALVPGCLAVQIAGLIVNVIGLVKASDEGAREKSIIGLCCAGLGLVFSVIALTFAANS